MVVMFPSKLVAILLLLFIVVAADVAPRRPHVKVEIKIKHKPVPVPNNRPAGPTRRAGPHRPFPFGVPRIGGNNPIRPVPGKGSKGQYNGNSSSTDLTALWITLGIMAFAIIVGGCGACFPQFCRGYKETQRDNLTGNAEAIDESPPYEMEITVELSYPPDSPHL